MKPFAWEKLGLIFQPDRSKPWMRSHASLPTPLHLEGDLYRVYFASRDERNRSHVGSFDLELGSAPRVVQVSSDPVLEPGPLGRFDDHGIYASSAVRNGEEVLLYTVGFNPGKTQPLFYASIGLAISRDGGGTFEKFGRAPIMARSDHDPCLVSAPSVLVEDGLWRMWYISGYRWVEHDGKLESNYHIKYAESADGIHWNREGVVSIDHAIPEETNISRVCISKTGEAYTAWFSYQSGDGYQIGYGESVHGRIFQRKDDLSGITTSETGWDSDAVAYPYVFEHKGRLYMLYNGNGFGRDGIGLAIAAS